MGQRLGTLAVGLAAGLIAAALTPALASAEGGCEYHLSAPRLVASGDTTDVSATLHVTNCPGKWQPRSTTVCVRADASAGQCAVAYSWNTAQVSLAAGTPGAHYIATGNGCAGASPGAYVCVPVGPIDIIV